MADEHITSFVDAHLSATKFAEYLDNPRRRVLKAHQDGQIVGYAMVVHEDETVELSKLYVINDFHGTALSTALMDAAVAAAADWGAQSIWLGVNQQNERAQRFYLKSGFTVTGTRTFQLGTHLEHDFVMTRPIA